MAKKLRKPLKEQIEKIAHHSAPLRSFSDAPIPDALAEHLEAFLSSLQLDALPEIDLMTQEGARQAEAYARELLIRLEGKQQQITKLKTALLSAQPDAAHHQED